MSQREILFKAKRLDNGEWFEGVPVDVTPLQCFSEPKENEVVLVRARFADGGMPRELEGAKVDPKTVCQYTGLTDKNGKKIFENDLVSFKYKNSRGKEKSESYVVTWEHNGYPLFDHDIGFDPYRLEVIGNTHDS